MKCVILRGFPGAGKTTLANQMLKKAADLPITVKGVICSADLFFTSASGRYTFVAAHLSRAHAFCRRAFSDALSKQIELVIVDNTNLTHEEWSDYAEMATACGYDVEITIVGEMNDLNRVLEAAKKSVHSVPQSTVRRMFAKLHSCASATIINFDNATVEHGKQIGDDD